MNISSASKIRHIGVFTSGGDAPGMNAALYGIAKTTSLNNIKLTGICKGFDGMIDNEFVELNENELQLAISKGGTVIQTGRSNRFLTLEGREQAKKNLLHRQLDAVIAIGGDGTFKGLLEFSDICTLPFIGIPGTIDNDLRGSDYTLGFDSAINTAIENIDKIRDTAISFNRAFLIEVMGRDSGYIAIHSGLASGADGILIPESKKDFYKLIEQVKDYHNDRPLLIVVSEADEFKLDLIMAKLKKVNPSMKIRTTTLGHIQRGGNPSASDRILGLRLGSAAVEAIVNGEKNKMVGIVDNHIKLTSFKQVIKEHKVIQELQEIFELFYLN